MERQCKRLFLIGMVTIFWAGNLSAQGPDTVWTKTYGGAYEDMGYSIQQTLGQGYIIAGFAMPTVESRDVWVIKTDSLGDTLWTRTYGGSMSEEAYSVQQTLDEGFVVAGYKWANFGDWWDFYLLKISASGDLQGTKTFGIPSNFDHAQSIKQTSDSGYIVVGYTSPLSPLDWDIYIVKIDRFANLMWDTTYGGTGCDSAFSVEQTSDNGYIIAGLTDSYGAGGLDVWLIKIDSLGNVLWSNTYGGTSDDVGYSVQQTSDNGYIIAGYTNSLGDGRQAYLIKTDSLGNTEWTDTFGDLNSDIARSVQETFNNGYVIAGGTQSFGQEKQIYIIETDHLGRMLWQANYGDSGDEEAYSVQQTADGGYVVVGYTMSEWNKDLYLIKLGAMVPATVEIIPDTLEFYVSETILEDVDTMWVKNTGGVILYVDSIIGDEDWIGSILPGSFDISPNDSQEVVVSVDTSGLSNGTYNATLTIHSNDPASPYEQPAKIMVNYGIEENYDESLPRETLFYPLSPNPARLNTSVHFVIAERSEVSLKVYNALGQEVNTVVQNILDKGEYRFIWTAKDDQGKRLSAGVYFFQLRVGNKKLSRRAVLF